MRFTDISVQIFAFIVLPWGIFTSGLKRSELMKELMVEYDKTLSPNFDNDNTTVVTCSVLIGSIDSINEITMDYDISIFLRQSWFDDRLKFGDLINDTMIPLDPTVIDKLWVPDLFFSNEKRGHIHHITTPNRLVRLYEDGRLLYSTRISLTLSCPMILHKFPMDTQDCKIIIESFAFTIERLEFRWRINHPVEINPMLEFPQFELVATKPSACTKNYTTGLFSCLEVQFTLRRSVGFYVFQTYIPSFLIVMLSWVSFWIHMDAVPARISLGVITILAMITQTSGIQQALPRVSYIKAIDVWMSTCLFFVFTALLEFAIVNVSSRRGLHDEIDEKSSGNNASNAKNEKKKKKADIDPQDAIAMMAMRHAGVKRDISGRKMARYIDVVSRKCFPLVFLLFNLIYWTVYCVIDEDVFR